MWAQTVVEQHLEQDLTGHGLEIILSSITSLISNQTKQKGGDGTSFYVFDS